MWLPYQWCLQSTNQIWQASDSIVVVVFFAFLISSRFIWIIRHMYSAVEICHMKWWISRRREKMFGIELRVLCTRQLSQHQIKKGNNIFLNATNQTSTVNTNENRNAEPRWTRVRNFITSSKSDHKQIRRRRRKKQNCNQSDSNHHHNWLFVLEIVLLFWLHCMCHCAKSIWMQKNTFFFCFRR